jgi:hypothetical protein
MDIIKKEVMKLINTYGRYVYYGRRDLKFKCSCYVERSGEASPNCKKCFGTGNPIETEMIKVRSRQASIPISMPNQYKHSDSGNFQHDAKTYYMDCTANPKYGDLIFEGEEREGKFYYKEIFLISLVDSKETGDLDTGINSMPDFFQVAARKIARGGSNDNSIS